MLLLPESHGPFSTMTLPGPRPAGRTQHRDLLPDLAGHAGGQGLDGAHGVQHHRVARLLRAQRGGLAHQAEHLRAVVEVALHLVPVEVELHADRVGHESTTAAARGPWSAGACRRCGPASAAGAAGRARYRAAAARAGCRGRTAASAAKTRSLIVGLDQGQPVQPVRLRARALADREHQRDHGAEDDDHHEGAVRDPGETDPRPVRRRVVGDLVVQPAQLGRDAGQPAVPGTVPRSVPAAGSRCRDVPGLERVDERAVTPAL